MNFLDWFFPKTCVGCGKVGAYFCPSCLKTLSFIGLICPICEKAQPFGETHPRCQTKQSLNGFIYFFNYENVIKQAIHQLKYRFVSNLVDELIDLADKQIQTNKDSFLIFTKYINENKPTIVPIPLFWQRENYRGFNQAELIAHKFAGKYNLPFNPHLLVRDKPTVSQTNLSPQKRRENVQGIFSVRTSHLPSSLLIIDDVWTTGATMKEAGGVLKEAGAREVWGVTIAR